MGHFERGDNREFIQVVDYIEAVNYKLFKYNKREMNRFELFPMIFVKKIKGTKITVEESRDMAIEYLKSIDDIDLFCMIF